MSTDLGTAGEMESRELVHFVTQQTRFALINNILQHPEQLPSMYELEELNPSVSEATVYKHIQKLIDAGIVKEVALDDDQRRQGVSLEVLRPHRGRAGPSSTNTISSPRRKPSNRSTRPSLTSPRRWSSTKFPSPGRRVTLTELASSQYSITVRFRTHPPASGTPTTREAGRPRPRPASRGTGAARRSRLRVHTSPPALGDPLRRCRRG